MMTVCHVSCQHGKEDIRIFLKECCSLAERGYRVKLIQQGDSYTKNGVEIIGYGERSRSVKYIRRLIDISRVEKLALKEDADLFHIHEPLLLPLAMKLKRRGKKVIFDSHEMHREQIGNIGSWNPVLRRIASRLYGKYEEYVLRHIDGMVFPCTKDGRHPFEGKCRRVITINNLPKLSELYDRYSENWPKTENSLCYLGTLSRERGVTNAVKAAAMTQSVLLLGGHFSTASYREQVLGMKEMEFVRYLGDVGREEVCKTIQSSEIGLANILSVGQYNQYDNLATKVYEYMSLGVPVILSESKFNRRMVSEYGFGVCVDPTSAEDIAQAINTMRADRAEMKRMGENGRRAVKEIFNWEKESEKLIDLYNAILQES